MGSNLKSESGSKEALEGLFDHLWQDYIRSNPQAKRIYDLILKREQTVNPGTKALTNDHIALRTYDLPLVGIEALAKHFRNLGYEQGGEYFFEQKKLYARHYQHRDPSMPKIFISELELAKCSPFVREVAQRCVASVSDSLVSQPEILWAGRLWPADHATYEKLLAESEYAAWLYAFGFRANHFTVSFNDLKSFKELTELNDFLRGSGFALNTSGGEIKGNPGELLEQSSTLAEKTKVQFGDGVFEIPSCYYEFARRYAGQSGDLYQGFIAASADKIFESTNVASHRG